jgi:hypothetical protein
MDKPNIQQIKAVHHSYKIVYESKKEGTSVLLTSGSTYDNGGKDLIQH